MTDGVFRVFRPDGMLQFDATAATLVFHSKGTVTTVSTTGFTPHWSNSSPSSALIPMDRNSNELFALYMPGYGYARYANVQHPTTGVWYHVYHTMAPPGSTVTWYRFLPATELAAPGSGWGPGLALYNESGQLTFHSDMRPMIAPAALTGVGASTQLPAGRSYASLVQTLAGHERYTWDGTQEVVENDKGQVIARLWNGVADGKLYGVKWNSPTNPSLVEVSFNDQIIQQDVNTSPTVPANSTFYSIPIEDVLFVDVTGL